MGTKIKAAITKIIRADYAINDEKDLVIFWDTIKFEDHGYRVGFKLFKGKDWEVKFTELKLTQVLFYLED